MAGAFESVTRVAIEEIILVHAKESKFGYMLSPDSFKDLANDLFQLLMTSRTLKAAGDRMIQTGSGGIAPRDRSTTVKGRAR